MINKICNYVQEHLNMKYLSRIKLNCQTNFISFQIVALLEFTIYTFENPLNIFCQLVFHFIFRDNEENLAAPCDNRFDAVSDVWQVEKTCQKIRTTTSDTNSLGKYRCETNIPAKNKYPQKYCVCYDDFSSWSDMDSRSNFTVRHAGNWVLLLEKESSSSLSCRVCLNFY